MIYNRATNGRLYHPWSKSYLRGLKDSKPHLLPWKNTESRSIVRLHSKMCSSYHPFYFCSPCSEWCWHVTTQVEEGTLVAADANLFEPMLVDVDLAVFVPHYH